MNSRDRKVRLAALGYGLRHGSSWYVTFPVESAGTTNYHRDLAAVDQYIANVEQMRDWQAINH